MKPHENPTETPLQDIVDTAQDNMYQLKRLDACGVDGICSALTQSHSITDICEFLDVGLNVYFSWFLQLSSSQRQQLQMAQCFWLEGMEAHLLREISCLSCIKPNGGEGQKAREQLNLHSKQIKLLEISLKGVQATLERINNSAGD